MQILAAAIIDRGGCRLNTCVSKILDLKVILLCRVLQFPACAEGALASSLSSEILQGLY